MPDPDRMVRLVDKAATLSRATRGRTGRLVRLDADEVMVVGDLHGNVQHFQEVLKRAALGMYPRRHLVLQEVIHGNFLYDDGSDRSHQLLDLTAALKCQFPQQVHYLPGNHELAQLTSRPIAREAGDLNAIFRAGVGHAYADKASEVYAAYERLWLALPIALRTSNRVFISHSIVPAAHQPAFAVYMLAVDELPAEACQPGGAIYHLLWGRDVKPETAASFLKAVDADWLVTGHLPCDAGYQTPNDRQIVIDAQEAPAGYALFPANRPLEPGELAASVHTF